MNTKTFKNYIFSSKIILVAIIFLICFSFSTYLHTSLTKKESIEHSTTISNQIFSSMYQIMRKGWSREDLKMFTDSLEKNFEGTNYEINIYRADIVKELFGDIKEKQKDTTLVDVLKGDIKEYKSFEDNVTRNIIPLQASNECLMCHANAKVGDVLGAVEVKQDLNTIFDESKFQFIIFFLIITPIFFISAFISSRYTSKKITKNLDLFKEKVEGINSVDDFKQFDSKNIDLYFKEFNEIIQNVDTMAEKLKNVAVDKELLEFEIKLLDKFIKKEAKQSDFDLLKEMCVVVQDASLCGLGQTAPNPVLSTIKYFEKEYLEGIKND